MTESDDTLIRSLQKVRETFDPGGNLPEDCAAWAREHEQAIDNLAALLRRVEPPQVPQEMTALDLEAIKEWLAEGSYHNREDWGATSLDCAEPCIEALLAEVERLRAAFVPPQGETKELTAGEGGSRPSISGCEVSGEPKEEAESRQRKTQLPPAASAGSVPASPPAELREKPDGIMDLPYERVDDERLTAAISLWKDEHLLVLRPFGWHLDGRHIPNEAEHFSREGVCAEHGWTVVCDYGPYIAIVRAGRVSPPAEQEKE